MKERLLRGAGAVLLLAASVYYVVKIALTIYYEPAIGIPIFVALTVFGFFASGLFHRSEP